jgi:hypothetical protein
MKGQFACSFSISLVHPGLKYPPGATRRQLQDRGDRSMPSKKKKKRKEKKKKEIKRKKRNKRGGGGNCPNWTSMDVHRFG